MAFLNPGRAVSFSTSFACYRNLYVNEETEMNFHLPTQSYFRQDLSFQQQFYQQKALSPLDDTKVWLKVRNMVLFLCPVVFAMNMWLASISDQLEQSIRTVENVRHELTEIQIDLRAKRDQVYSPENVLMLASSQLSLDVPDKERIVLY